MFFTRKWKKIKKKKKKSKKRNKQKTFTGFWDFVTVDLKLRLSALKTKKWEINILSKI